MGCAGAVCARLAASGVEKQLPGLGFYAFGDRQELRTAARSKGGAGGDGWCVGLG